MARNMQFHLWQLIRLTILLMAVQSCCGQPRKEKCHDSGLCFSVFGKAKSIMASKRCKNNSQELLKLDDLELHERFLQDHFRSQLLGGAWLEPLVSPSSSAGSRDSEPVDDYQAHCLLLDLGGPVEVPCSGQKHFVICYKGVGRHSSSTRVPIIIGGVIGGVVVVAIVVAILVYAFVCRKSKGSTNHLTDGSSKPRAVSNNYEDCDEQPNLGCLQRQTRNAPPAYNVVVQNGGQNQNGGGPGLQPAGVVVGSHLYDNPRSPGASRAGNETY